MRALWRSLHDDLMRSVDTLSFKRRFDAVRASQPALRRFLDHDALLDHLHSPSGDLDDKDRILASLLTIAQRPDPAGAAAKTLAWLALWPGLDALYRRLRRHYPGVSDELVSAIGDHFTTALSRFDASRVRRVAATVLRNVERGIRDGLRGEWIRASRQAPPPDDPDRASTAFPLPLPVPESAFALPPQPDPGLAAVALRTALVAIVGADADLVMAVAVAGERQGEVAGRLLIAPDAARKRYRRAIARLRSHLEAA